MITNEAIKNVLNYIASLPLLRISLCCTLCAYNVWIGFVADKAWRDGDGVMKAMVIGTVVASIVGVAVGCVTL